MANFIDLDSLYRDKEAYPNENNYELTPVQVREWFRKPREVRAFPQNPAKSPLEFVVTVNIKILTLPYTPALEDLPRIYVDFHSRRYPDVNLLSTIGGVHPTARFVCTLKKVQTDATGANKLWAHYECNMEQTMRMMREDPVVIVFTSPDGQTLPSQDDPLPAPPNPFKQSYITFCVTSYLRDGDYMNHLTEVSSIV